MLEPLLERIRDLERANRRWKALSAVLATMLLAVFVAASIFMGQQGYRALVQNREAMQAMEAARMQEMAARAQAEAALERAEEAMREVQEQHKKN